MAIAISLNIPEFIDEYEGYKMREFVNEVERLHAALTREFDESGDPSFEFGGTQYDLLFNATGTEWYDTAGELIWNPDLDYLQLKANHSINWLDNGDISKELLVMTSTGGAGGDPDFSSVVALLPMNGADGDTSTTDDSNSAHTFTFFGNAQLDTAQFKFGTSSLLLDGSGDWIQAPDHANWSFGGGPFTWEAHIRFNGSVPTGSRIIAAQWTVAGNNKSWAFRFDGSAGLQAFTSNNGSGVVTVISEAWSPAADTWYHIAFCRDNSGPSVMRVFVDGVQLGTDDTAIQDGSATPLFQANSPMSIGRVFGDGEQYFVGWIDNVRITEAVCRYGSNFTAPTAEYSSPVVDNEFIVGDPTVPMLLEGSSIRLDKLNVEGDFTVTDSAGDDSVVFDHDGADFNITGNATTDINITGITAINLTGAYQVADAAGPTMVNEAATATNPTLIPNVADLDTGIGWAAADQLAAIAGGVEAIRYNEASSHILVDSEVDAGITAGTTQTQAGGFQLLSSHNEVATVANTNDTVVAPLAAAGRVLTILNNGANTLQIFPAVGDDIGAGVDTAITLAAGGKAWFMAYDATTWTQFV